jgi:hypothetical protein
LEQEEERKCVFGAHIENFKGRRYFKNYSYYLYPVKNEIKVRPINMWLRNNARSFVHVLVGALLTD